MSISNIVQNKQPPPEQVGAPPDEPLGTPKQKPLAGGGSWQDVLKGIDPNNWASGLGAVEDQLKGMGISLQRTSGGDIRGRLYGSQWGGGYYDPFNDYGWKVAPGSGGGGGMGGMGGGYTEDPRSSELYNLLMHRATQSLNINPQDPIIKNQTDIFNATQTRNSRDYLRNVAERAGPLANIRSETRHAAEHVGQNTSQFQGELMSRELGARRQEIMSALQGMQGVLSDQQRLRLESELRRLEMAQNAYQFDVNDEFRRSPLAA